VFFPLNTDVELDGGAVATVMDLQGTDPPISFPLHYRAGARQLVAIAPPGTVLREGHAYGCVIESGVHDAQGRPLRPSPEMRSALGPGGPPSFALLAERLTAEPQAATAFTTQSIGAWVPNVAADLAGLPARAHPTRVFLEGPDLDALFGGAVTTARPGRPSSGGVLHANVAAVVIGTFDAPDYLVAPPEQARGFDSPQAAKGTGAIPFILVLPKGVVAPAAAPVAMFQHGINGDRSTVLLVADDYAARGYATFGIDALGHGSRRPGAMDKLNNLSGAAVPDGIGDPEGLPVAVFFDLFGDAAAGVAPVDPRIIRDNFRQSTAELMQAARLLRGGDWSELGTVGLGGVALDGSKLLFTSASFGSMLGAGLMAVDPSMRAAVLDTASGGLFTDLTGNSPALAPLLSPTVGNAYDVTIDVDHPDTNPVRGQMSLNLIQTVLERGDALALARGAPADTSVLFLEMYNDEVVSNHATEALAAAWGATQVRAQGPATRVVPLPQAAPPLTAATLRALVTLDPAGHTTYTAQTEKRNFQDGFPPFVKLPTPVDVTNPIERAHRLALDFMDGFRAGSPVVSDAP
jgi:hypothetical protein